ncbi:MAG: 16S rRNA (cytidine(1402)-2'-O)-methyltransferase [Alphaproteobacteria bacterium]|nr:16S rRNA (cytidine(1402)-2'-O)-methyltransferase [Alphaproteobacteria bacterium]
MSETCFIKGLYLVATPIGNLGDISSRAIEVLTAADTIACEDTRNTQKLLNLLGIKKKRLTAYHEYNADKARPYILERLRNGEMIALVSDAGTPLVSDPGYRLVQDCISQNIYVTAIPGASAVLTALQLSGLPSHRFLFEGFLPPKTTARKKELALLAEVPATLIFYESPQRLEETLKDMIFVLGDRYAAVVRELTKKFEQTIRGTFSDLLTYYQKNNPPKGEIVIVVSPAEQKKESLDEIRNQLTEALKKMSVKEAVFLISQSTSESRKTIYQMAVEIKNASK